MRFTAHTVVHRGHVGHEFAPGDEVPEWAVDLVGAHVTADDTSSKASQSAGADRAEEEHSEAKKDQSPDFTKPAARTTRPRKRS